MRTVYIAVFVSVLLFLAWFGLRSASTTGEAVDSRSREIAFQELFGFPPPSDVRDVKSTWYRSGRLYVQWIRVGCGPETVNRIRNQKRVTPSRYQIFHPGPGVPLPSHGLVQKLWFTPGDAIPKWWTNAVDLPANSERFTLGWQTSAKQDLVFVWLNAGEAVVYAGRNVNEYD